MYYKIISIDRHETWAWEGARVGARPPSREKS